MAVVRNPLESFVWGKGGAALTPEEIAQQREVEQALLAKNGIDTSPVGHWTQGIARVLGAAGGAYRRNKLDAAGAESNDYNSSIVNSLLGGSASAPTVPASAAAGEISATSPTAPIDMNGNEVYSQFIDTVKQGGVQNPYALAAIAATGKAESGFDPGNVNRTWSDPSQSGHPGTAGGIMSWRGPRYDALAATGDLSPAGQAKFFLQEDPNLIAALNKAGSVEEAQSLMNRAWAFAGYDQPGGEAERRLQTAQSLLPSFQASGEVAATSPQAAIEAIAPTQGASLSDEVSAFRQTPEYAAQFPGQQMETASSSQQSPVVQQMAQAAPAQTGINPAILRALSDPRATPQTRAVAQALMQQDAAQQQAAQEQQTWMQRQQYEQAQQANDPLRQLQIQKAQSEVERGEPLINAGDGSVYNPNTKEWMQDPNRAQKAPALSELFDEQTGQPYKAQWNPETKQFERVGGIKAPTGTSLSVSPDGQVSFTQGGAKPLTENQSKLTLFQTLQTQTQPVLLDLEAQWNPVNTQDSVARSTPIAGNFFKSEQGQIYDASATAWAEGALRIATGAAATPDEMERTKRAYFAQPGDTPNTISFKAQMREMYNRAINASLGKPDSGEGLPKPSEFIKAAAKDLPAIEAPAVGQNDPAPDGVDPGDWEFMSPEDRALFK